MPNNITFYVPKPASGGGVINLGLRPKKFLAQFQATAPSSNSQLPDALTIAGCVELISAALDSGYGANAEPMHVFPFWDRLRLKRHGLLKGMVVQSLLKFTTNVGWHRAAFVPVLEETEEIGDAYWLGMLYARVSTERCGKEKQWGKVKRFWHYKVLEKSAANFGVGYVPKALNPDFLVEFTKGQWACVEAKGSLGHYEDTNLREGMRQAMKLSCITWQSPGKPLEFVTPHEYACSMAYFDKTRGDSLEVFHLDPPSHYRSKLAKPGDGAPVYFKEAADLLEWFRAIEQFQELKNGDKPQCPASFRLLD